LVVEEAIGGREDGYHIGKLGAIISVRNPREMVGTKTETSLELYEFEQEVFLLQDEVSGDGEELEGRGPLSIVPLAVSVGKDHPSSVSPRWVVERVKGCYKLVGLSCDRFEDKLMALFEEIEATRDQT
jgi:hypothetical protein